MYCFSMWNIFVFMVDRHLQPERNAISQITFWNVIHQIKFVFCFDFANICCCLVYNIYKSKQTGAKPLPESMLIQSLLHICIIYLSVKMHVIHPGIAT